MFDGKICFRQCPKNANIRQTFRRFANLRISRFKSFDFRSFPNGIFGDVMNKTLSAVNLFRREFQRSASGNS